MSARAGYAALVLVVALGCGGDDNGATGSTSTPASSGAGSSSTATIGSDATGSGQGTATADDTGPDPDTTAATSTDATTASDADTTTGEEVAKLCSLEVIDPLADPAAVIDAGDLAGQIPTTIGQALLRNCGCHYTDEVSGYTDYISNAAPMSTWTDFHDDFEGVFPAGFGDRPTWEACEVRVVFNLPLPMPPPECDVQGEPGNISNDDFVLFAQWFEAGAPDGANFP